MKIFSSEQINAADRCNRWTRQTRRTNNEKKRMIAHRTRLLISIVRSIYHLELSNMEQALRASNTRLDQCNIKDLATTLFAIDSIN